LSRPKIEVCSSEQLKRVITHLWDNRLDFAKEIIGMKPTDQQAEALIALDSHDEVAHKAGHGIGKSSVSAALILHYMSCRPFPKIPCTAPSRHQLHDVLWSELSKWHRSMKASDVGKMFSDMCVWQKEKFFHRDHPEEWFAAARTATKENPEALQGFHADYILKITDEASAIPEDVFDVLEGAHGMQETKLYMPGNPTRLEGTFYNAFHKSKDFYYRISSSTLDSPIVPANYAKKMAAKYGTDSNIYRIRVLGEFPKQDGDSYIPFDLVQSALVREGIEDDLSYPLVLGVDVARFGDDDTVILPRRGNKTYEYKILRHKDTMATVGEVARMANRLKANMIFVDVIGVGAGVYDRLNQLGYPVTPVNASESPATKPEVFRKQRDELWGLCLDWLETKCVRLWDNDEGDLAGELTTPKYSESNGKIIIESKQEMKKRGVASPNIADALNLTFALPSSEIMPIDTMGIDSVQSEQPFDSEAGY
jgi:phage terminase large subunit